MQQINKQLNVNKQFNANKQLNINKQFNNITNNFVGLGHENLGCVFTKKEKLYILNQIYECLPHLIEYAILMIIFHILKIF